MLSTPVDELYHSPSLNQPISKKSSYKTVIPADYPICYREATVISLKIEMDAFLEAARAIDASSLC